MTQQHHASRELDISRAWARAQARRPVQVRIGTVHELLSWADRSGELLKLPGRINGKPAPRGVGPFWCDLFLLLTLDVSLALIDVETMCVCAQHCADHCEPSHCPPGTPRCACWCHRKESRP